MRKESPWGIKTILTKFHGKVGLVELNRPEARNALNNQLVHKLMDALEAYDRDDEIGAMVVTGSEGAFAAGADIKEMASQDPAAMRSSDFIQAFARLAALHKPLIAAVSGWALGGGCEIALACDGCGLRDSPLWAAGDHYWRHSCAGGTQRLPRVVGKSLAMEVILNNRILNAQEALQFGLVNRLVPADRCVPEAVALAEEIASRAPAAVLAAKMLIARAFESPLADGLQLARYFPRVVCERRP